MRIPGNIRKLTVTIFILLYFINVSGTVQAQEDNGIKLVNAFADSLYRNFPKEKLYLQTDKVLYNQGDTIWFKGYLFDARYLSASTKSGVVYVEVINQHQKMVRKILLETNNGLFSGSIPLASNWLQAGVFTIRSYTNWMRNPGAGPFFTGKLCYNPGNSPLEVKPADKEKRGLRAVQSAATNNRPGQEAIDLQFMPEGGHLVAGLASRVGFKATGPNGTGVNLAGVVYDSKNNKVTDFNALHAGMGNFTFTPLAGENYHAIVHSGVLSSRYELPKVRATGIVLEVINAPGSDHITVQMTASADISTQSRYYLIAQSRGAICYGAIASFKTRVITSILRKDKFQSGMVSITLLDEHLRPLNERMTFINHHDDLKISINTSQATFTTRDSVSLHLKVTDMLGKPVAGSFSIAVTDNALTPADTTHTLLTDLLLTSDLQGEIVDPGYYFIPGVKNQTALDNLLLTQGWVDDHWTDLKLPVIRYPAQPAFTISGKITNVLNKGVPNTRVKLFSRGPFFVMDTASNANGEFVFANLPAIDSANFLLQALKNNGASKNVGFLMQDDQSPPLTAMKNPDNSFLSPDSTQRKILNNNSEVQKALGEMYLGKNVLKEVVIKGSRIIKGSKNLNGPGNADEIVDEKELLKDGKERLMDLLNRRITGFHEGVFPVRLNSIAANKQAGNNNSAPTLTDRNLNVRKNSYMIKSHRVKFVFDGIDAESFFQPADLNEGPLERFLFLKGMIEQFSAEDVKGLEVMYSGKYNNAYNAYVSSGYELSTFISPVNDVDYAYIEITTRSGKGPMINLKDGFYAYRPLMPSPDREFYKPRYQNKNTSLKTDFRSTLHWEPNAVTGPNGEVTVSFFTSDRTGNFTITAEGSNMNGLIGAGTAQLMVR